MCSPTSACTLYYDIIIEIKQASKGVTLSDFMILFYTDDVLLPETERDLESMLNVVHS